MRNGSDSSILRSLAVAFGDGLAFAVGVKLTQSAARQAGAAPRSAPGDLPERLTKVEQTVKRIERAPVAASTGMDHKVLEAIVNAVEARLKEHGGQVERKLADLEARMAIDLKALDEQDHAVAEKVTGDLNALEGQMISLNREFGEAVARIVAGQVTEQVEARAAAVEQRLAAMVSGRLEPMERQLREEIGEKDREIAELRRRVADADTNLLDIVSGIGQICRQAAERMGGRLGTTQAGTPVAADTAPADTPVAEEATQAGPPADREMPVPQPNRLWRVPMVSSLVALVTGGLILAHYL